MCAKSTNNNITTLLKALGLTNAPEECLHNREDMSDHIYPRIHNFK